MPNDLRFRATMDDKVSGPLDRMKDKFDVLGKSKGAQQVLGGVGLGIGAKSFDLLGEAASRAAEFVGGSIQAASDMAETQSKVGVVFGQSAKDIDAWGSTAAKSLGLSKQAAEESAASFGNLFEGAGLAQKGAADLSKGVVGLASDLASFNNLDPAETLEKLRSGLVGEAEPLRSLGVNLTEAQVQAQATSMGFKKVNGAFSEGDKILARYQLILKSTTTAQGDFARTSDGLANSQRTVNAELDDAKVQLGKSAIGWELFWTKAQIGALDFLQDDPLGKIGQGFSQIYHVLSPTAGEFDRTWKETGKLGKAMDLTGKSVDDLGGRVSTQLGPGGTVPAAFDYAALRSRVMVDKIHTNLTDAKSTVDSDSQALADAMLNPIAGSKRIKQIQDELTGKWSTGKQLIAGLKSSDPLVREAAAKLQADLREELTGLQIQYAINWSTEKKGDTPHHAKGGFAPYGELAVFGEEGPEAGIPMPGGLHILTAPQTRALGASGGHTTTININSVWPPTPAQAREIVQAISEEQYFEFSRSSQSATRK